jgi:hypothetical protein
MPESDKYYQSVKNRLREKAMKEKAIHLREISTRYKEAKNDIYMQFLKENNFQEWKDPQHGHSLVIPPIKDGNKYFETISILQSKDSMKGMKLEETFTVTDMLKKVREDNMSFDDMMSQPLKDIEDILKEEK